MPKNLHCEKAPGYSEWLKSWSRPAWRVRRVVAAVVCLCFLAGASDIALGQSAPTGVEAYAQAIKQSVIAQRITYMDRYLSLSSNGSLKIDALEFLIWDHMRLGHQAQANQRALELLGTAPLNPIAIAVLNQSPPAALKRNAVIARLQMLRSAAIDLNSLRKPEGMQDRNFQTLRQQVGIMLNGAAGLCYLQIEDYADARPTLQEAADNDPNNPQWVYSLALALLNGKNKDTYRGYWYLARAANLTGQTPEGQQIADYAWRKYRSDGGKDADWQTFLASAAALDSPPSPAGSSPAAPATTTVASASSSGARPMGTPAPAAPSRSTTASARTNTQANGSSSKTKSSGGFEATLREPARISTTPSRPPDAPKAMAAPSEAVSLGILIETSLLTNRNRGAIIATLKDIVRNLRANDEACILIFSDQLDFEQDLTADDTLLEEALSQIRPRSGRALLSGITFAAGHLKRIGKNSQRVLLVISDGETNLAKSDTVQFRSQVAGVRIDCIGLKDGGSMDRSLLEWVASYSGGKASFASDPGEFRTAALEMTRGMGIAIP
ncbi:MAG TPA: VWA domain-containing protein [Candidatus Angelobacter sp.]|nr:VWA domain-containing protein [Candidatus Angelobacter sp.]